jgi:hypothetical protein
LSSTPDAESILSQPGMRPLLGARVLGEFGDAPGRYADAKARKKLRRYAPAATTTTTTLACASSPTGSSTSCMAA